VRTRATTWLPSRRFALAELLPRYARGDRTGEYPREQIKRTIALIGEEARSPEDNLIFAGIVAEEVARGDFNCVLPSLAPLVFHQFIAEASDELRARWLPGLRSGEQMIGLCLTEPDAGSDMGAMRTRAERRGDVYVLNGEKNSVSYHPAGLPALRAAGRADRLGGAPPRLPRPCGFTERVDRFVMGRRPVELPVAGVFEIRGGRIAAWRDYFDMQTWTRQTTRSPRGGKA
jgi:alkylation response protein AidB-like acyl-CoA dehydrogenase